MNLPAPQPQTARSEASALDHLDYLDGWRGVAIILLLIGHFTPVPGLNFGALGVNFFFVLSGFLMAKLLFVRQVDLGTFYRRRISRIIPGAAFFILSMALVYKLAGKPVSLPETLAALFFYNNYTLADPASKVMPFGHIWSLCVEEHSYVFLSILALVCRQWQALNSWRLLALAAALSSAIGIYYGFRFTGRELEFNHWLHSEVSAYGILISSAMLFFWAGRKIPRVPVPVLVLLMLVGVLAHWWKVPLAVRTTLGVAAFAVVVNVLSNAPAIVKSALSWAPLRWAGKFSFSIYLWQQPFYLASRSDQMPLALALPLAIACGLLSYHLVEQPVRSYLNRVWCGRAPATPAATGSSAKA